MVGAAIGGGGPLPAGWQPYSYPDAGAVLQTHPVLEDGEDVLRAFPDVCLTLGEASEQGVGTLYVTSRRAIWVSAESPGAGVAVPFVDIVLHAVSSDPRPCIYAQLQGGFADEGDAAGPEEPTPGGGESMDMRLSPADASALETMFQSFCEAAALNPDEGEEGDDGGGGEGGGAFFYNQEQALAGADPALREQALARLDQMLADGGDDDDDDDEGGEYEDEEGAGDAERFADAEEEAGGGVNGKAAR